MLLIVVAVVVVLVVWPDSKSLGADETESTVSSRADTTQSAAGAGPPATHSGPQTTVAPGTTTTLQATTTTLRTAAGAAASSVSSSTSSSTSIATTTTSPPWAGKVVVIDPGHQAKGNYDPEPIGPGSSRTKAKASSGTAGVATGIPESELNLAVSLALRDALAAAGVEVVMTRTSQDIDLSNIQRAEIANHAHADLFIRMHADGASDPATTGIHVLYPAVVRGWTDDIAAPSQQAAALAQKELIAATGAKDRGIDARADMTGFNWSDVPAIIPEIGFMTNPAEDRLLATPSYRDAIVGALTRAILDFLSGG